MCPSRGDPNDLLCPGAQSIPKSVANLSACLLPGCRLLSLSLWSAIADWIRVLTNGDDREGGVQNLVSEGRVKADGQQVRTGQAHETVARRTVRLPVVKVNHIIKKEREKKNPEEFGWRETEENTSTRNGAWTRAPRPMHVSVVAGRYDTGRRTRLPGNWWWRMIQSVVALLYVRCAVPCSRIVTNDVNSTTLPFFFFVGYGSIARRRHVILLGRAVARLPPLSAIRLSASASAWVKHALRERVRERETSSHPLTCLPTRPRPLSPSHPSSSTSTHPVPFLLYPHPLGRRSSSSTSTLSSATASSRSRSFPPTTFFYLQVPACRPCDVS